MTKATNAAPGEHDRVAYARNGNTHNPTKYYVYDVFSAAGGHQIAYGIRTLAKAKEYASETQQSQTWLI